MLSLSHLFVHSFSHSHILLGSSIAFHKLVSTFNNDRYRFPQLSTEAISIYVISVQSVISPSRLQPYTRVIHKPSILIDCWGSHLIKEVHYIYWRIFLSENTPEIMFPKFSNFIKIFNFIKDYFLFSVIIIYCDSNQATF